jgi:hypothetical protein
MSSSFEEVLDGLQHLHNDFDSVQLEIYFPFAHGGFLLGELDSISMVLGELLLI